MPFYLHPEEPEPIAAPVPAEEQAVEQPRTRTRTPVNWFYWWTGWFLIASGALLFIASMLHR